MEFSAYLMFNGDCEAAINFYKEALDANLLHFQRFGDSDMPDLDPALKDKVLHCGIEKDGFIIMASDSNVPSGGVVRGDNVQLSINHNSEGEIDKIFAAISAGGKVTMPLQDTFWGAKFGMCVDKFGVSWMFNYDRPKDN